MSKPLHDTLTTLSQRAEGAFQDAGRPLLRTLARVTKSAEIIETACNTPWRPSDGNGAPSLVAWRWPPWWSSSLGWLAISTLVSWRSAELEQLNMEIAQSEARLAELNRRGGKIRINRLRRAVVCPCVY